MSNETEPSGPDESPRPQMEQARVDHLGILGVAPPAGPDGEFASLMEQLDASLGGRVVVTSGPPVLITADATPAVTEAKPKRDYRVIVEQMTRRDAAASRRPGLRARKVIVQSSAYLPTVAYVGPEGFTNHIEEADIFTIGEVLNMYRDDDLFNLIDEEVLKLEPPHPKFRLEAFVDAHTLNLMKNSPRNPIVHAMVLARFKHKPPATISTYEELKEWVELNGERPTTPVPVPKSPTGTLGTRPVLPGITVLMTHEHTAHGRCRWSQVRMAKSRVEWTHSEIIELIEEGLDFDEIEERICEGSRENFGENEYDDEAVGGYEYEDHEEGDSDWHDGPEIETSVSQSLRSFIEANCTEAVRRDLLP